MTTRIGLLIVALCVLAASSTGCGPKEPARKAPEQEIGEVLARIGDETITVQEFEKRLDQLPDNIVDIARENKAAYLDNMVVETLLYQEAVSKGLDNDPEVRALFDEAKKRILIARLAQDEIEDMVDVTEEEKKAYYEENKDEMRSPELFRASHILVDTMDEAVEITDKLNAGALFDELARQYSKDVTASRGGDLGYFSAGQMLPEFEDACMRLKIGEISGPVKTEFGYHIIKLTDKRGPEPMEYDEVKEKIEQILRTRERGRLLEDLVEELKASTDLEINAELVLEEGEAPEEPLTGLPALEGLSE